MSNESNTPPEVTSRRRPLLSSNNYHRAIDLHRLLRDNSSTTRTHNAIVQGVVLISCAAVEARIGEIFSTLSGENFQVNKIEGLSDSFPPAVRRTAQLLDSSNSPNWRQRLQQLAALEDKEPFDIGSGAGQDYGLLAQLRNNLIHAPPTWVTTKSDGSVTITEQALFESLSSRIPVGNFDQSSRFPVSVLVQPLAVWALLTGRGMINYVNSHLGYQYPDLPDPDSPCLTA